MGTGQAGSKHFQGTLGKNEHVKYNVLVFYCTVHLQHSESPIKVDMSEYYYKNLRTLVVFWLAVWSPPPYSASPRQTRAANGGIYPCITKEVGGRRGQKGDLFRETGLCHATTTFIGGGGEKKSRLSSSPDPIPESFFCSVQQK